MISKLAIAVSAVGLAALVAYPLVLQAQTSAPTADSIAPKSLPQQGADVPARKAATSASDEQDAMILARQGLMEGIYQYMEDADDWTDRSASASDAAMLQALTREAGHTALMLPAFKQLFPPFTLIPRARNFPQRLKPTRYPASGQSRMFFLPTLMPPWRRSMC
jgi:hypothetical protein